MTALADHHDALALLALGDALSSRLDMSALMEVCPPPLHRWVANQRHKILALAIDAMHRGEIKHDGGAAMDYLSRIRFSDAMDAIKGRPLVMSAAVTDDDTALGAGRIMSLMGDAGESRTTAMGSTYGSPQRVASMLRCISDRTRFLAEMERTASALSRVSIMEDAAPIMAPLAALMRTGSVSTHERSLGESLLAAIGTAERESDDERAQGMTWGLKSLDEAIPLRAGRTYVLSAQPGGGKTSLGMQSAHATSSALGFRSVAYLSLEMAAPELAMALACREVQVPRKQAEERWASLHPDDRTELRTIAERWTHEGAMWIRDSSAGGVTAAEVAAWIRAQRQRHGALRLVVVDYLGLISASNPRQQLTEKTSEITRTLKQVALSEGVAIILLAQLTREGRKGPRGAQAGPDDAAPVPRMEDLLGGSSIESDADGIVLLHPIQKEGETRRINAIIAKNRRGERPTLPMWFNGKYQYFIDAKAEEKKDDAAIESRKSRTKSAPTNTEDLF